MKNIGLREHKQLDLGDNSWWMADTGFQPGFDCLQSLQSTCHTISICHAKVTPAFQLHPEFQDGQAKHKTEHDDGN